MAKVALHNGEVTVTNATTTFNLIGAGGQLANSQPEASFQRTWQQAGVFSGLRIFVDSNSFTASSTFRFRKNTANGNQVVSFPAAATGFFSDLVNTDSVVATDIVNTQFNRGSVSAGNLGFSEIDFNSSGGDTYANHIVGPANGGAGVSTTANSSTTSIGFAAVTTFDAEGSLSSYLFEGTMKHGYTRVSANARTSATTIVNRINGVDGAITMSVGAAATGNFEDTTHTNTIATGDLCNWNITTGAGAGENIVFQNFGIGISTTTSRYHLISQHNLLASLKSIFFAVGNWNTSSNNTESDRFITQTSAFIYSSLTARVSSNSLNVTSTIKSRMHAVNAGLSISITNGTTGTFQDLTGSDKVVAGERYALNADTTASNSGLMALRVTLMGKQMSPATFLGVNHLRPYAFGPGIAR